MLGRPALEDGGREGVRWRLLRREESHAPIRAEGAAADRRRIFVGREEESNVLHRQQRGDESWDETKQRLLASLTEELQRAST